MNIQDNRGSMRRASPTRQSDSLPLPTQIAPGRPFSAKYWTSASLDKTMSETLVKLRYRYWPDHIVGEILSKRWTETAIPVAVLIAVIWFLAQAIPGYFSGGQIIETLREGGEIGLIVLGLSLVIMVGGIDLSVGSMFAICNFVALLLIQLLDLPMGLVIVGTMAVGALLGGFNGVLIGYLKLRAFLTTLITLIIFRAIYDILILRYSTDIAAELPHSAVWDFIGAGDAFGLPFAAILLGFLAVGGHFFLSRLRHGWHVMAIGGSRRAAHNAGIAVRRTVALTYVASGVLTAMSASLFASRLGTLGGDVGQGLEVTVLTAAILGGISLGGGKGSVTKALVGTFVVLLVTNGLTALSAPGGLTKMVLAGTLLVAATFDIRWNRNRQRFINSVYVSPTYLALPPSPACGPDTGTVWQLNDKLRDVEVIGLGQVEGPEDIILDSKDNLYCGSRFGDIMRFRAPDYKEVEVFAHIGGTPLGMAFDKDENLYVCVAGMGLYRVTPSREVQKVTDETNRRWNSIVDDSRLRLADDLDIAPDGRVFFSEASIRYEMSSHMLDVLEARGNGRIVCWDPATNKTKTMLSGLHFPNGISIAPDGQSLFFALTTGCSVMRYWFDGPRKGQVAPVLENLPGYPDNINLASDGNYWLALVGLRSPTLDLANRMPGFRKRMTRRLPVDEWMFPQINNGCVLKFTPEGEILETLWDEHKLNHPMITSMREHKGSLFLGGLVNNRIGRYTLPKEQADPGFVQYQHRWGTKA
ncbi:ABC transporter permease [Sphingobium sp.]|uniref:ABC transporter permease n=1 Tax=Sphingobium sp. TaxID=1912891 RepID=UPI0028BEF521|nr:SMP-30/gluconolactonase/LRE family protein [Sphingobium sp.]